MTYRLIIRDEAEADLVLGGRKAFRKIDGPMAGKYHPRHGNESRCNHAVAPERADYSHLEKEKLKCGG